MIPSLCRCRSSRERLPSFFTFSFCFILLFASLSSVSALTREQAEQIDWSKKNLGSISHARFVRRRSSSSSSPSSSSPSASPGSDALLVAAAETGSIALLDATDGEIIWRKVREQERDAGLIVAIDRNHCN
jgi:hypothetical protein